MLSVSLQSSPLLIVNWSIIHLSVFSPSSCQLVNYPLVSSLLTRVVHGELYKFTPQLSLSLKHLTGWLLFHIFNLTDFGCIFTSGQPVASPCSLINYSMKHLTGWLLFHIFNLTDFGCIFTSGHPVASPCSLINYSMKFHLSSPPFLIA